MSNSLEPDHYTLKDLCEMFERHEGTILSWGTDKGLIFSSFFDIINIELGIYNFDLETFEGGVEKYSSKIVDLNKSVIVNMRKHREAYLNDFRVNGYDYAGWWGPPAPPKRKSNSLVVTKDNLINFLNEYPKLQKHVDFTVGPKPGPKPTKLYQAADKMFDDLVLGKVSPEELSNTIQYSIAFDYKVSRGTADKARTLALAKYKKYRK